MKSKQSVIMIVFSWNTVFIRDNTFIYHKQTISISFLWPLSISSLSEVLHVFLSYGFALQVT
jgi:hypothetical protein